MKHDPCAYVKRGPSTVSRMVRRSLWLGLRLGLLLGIGFAVFKTVQSRRTLKEPATPPPWEPLTPREPPKPSPAPAPAPAPRRPEPVADNPPTWQEVPTEVAEPEPAPAPRPVFEQPAPAPAPVEEAAIPSVPDPALDVPIAPVQKVAKAAKAAKKAAKKVAKKAVAKKAVAPPPQPWVDPDGGVCPPTHPVKGKLASRLFHLPGMFAYDRTKADRCYLDAAAAEADGLTRAKR